MVTVIFGVVVLALLLLAMNAFAKVDPRTLAPILKAVGGVGALGGAVFLASRGQIGLAVTLGVAGMGLLGWLPFGPAGIFQRTQKSSGQVSRVRSAFVEMELDHDTGAMRGRILAGQYEGVMLDALDLAILTGLLPNIDEESRALLMAYLDRRQPRWRDDVQGDAATGPGRTLARGAARREVHAHGRDSGRCVARRLSALGTRRLRRALWLGIATRGAHREAARGDAHRSEPPIRGAW